MRGDGIRLWYSHDNLIENNLVTDTRDMVAWYSHRNIYRGNEGRRSRYSIHFMFANDNIVENNRFTTTPSAFTSCTWRAARTQQHHLARHRRHRHGVGLQGVLGHPAREQRDHLLRGRRRLGPLPFQPDTTIRLSITASFNGIAVQLTSELGGNELSGNTFEGNLTDMFQAGRGERQQEQVGRELLRHLPGVRPRRGRRRRHPHEEYAYADRIWMDPQRTLLQDLARPSNCSISSSASRRSRPPTCRQGRKTLYIKPERRTEGSAS